MTTTPALFRIQEDLSQLLADSDNLFAALDAFTSSSTPAASAKCDTEQQEDESTSLQRTCQGIVHRWTTKSQLHSAPLVAGAVNDFLPDEDELQRLPSRTEITPILDEEEEEEGRKRIKLDEM